jgi:alkylation response protein AidB-like acyl-CoA dehydrogenase
VDLRLSGSEQRFQDELVAWLTAVKAPAGLRDYGATPTQSDVEPGRLWQRMLYDAGWAGMSWPASSGGRGATPLEQAIFAEEMAQAGKPRQLNIVSLELAGPMIDMFGTTAQRERFLQPILRGEEIWCQLFSEPNAGSDLAGLACKAVQTDAGWSVHGQKVWTSGAQFADFGLLLARTDVGSVGHRGISCFLLPMERAGIEVRPLVQMDGEAKFNEVFFDDVRVTSADLLGELGNGWRVAMSTLGRERLSLGAQAVTFLEHLDGLVRAARANGRADTALFRQEHSALWTRVRLLRLTWLRALQGGGAVSTPQMSILKLASSELQRDIAAASSFAGVGLVAGQLPDLAHRLLAAPGQRLAGGTSEIQRNILGERILGLPKEPVTAQLSGVG